MNCIGVQSTQPGLYLETNDTLSYNHFTILASKMLPTFNATYPLLTVMALPTDNLGQTTPASSRYPSALSLPFSGILSSSSLS